MKKMFVFILCLCCAGMVMGHAKPRKKIAKETQPIEQKVSPVLDNAVDSAAYALGMVLGADLHNVVKQFPGDPIDGKLMLQAMNAAFTDDTVLLPMDVAKSYLQVYTQAAHKMAEEKYKAAQIAFLVENAKRPEVITLPSGLQYEVLIPADGPKPTATSDVTVHYEGCLIDGTVFDSSYQRGNPSTFRLARVIKGWTEGMQLMSPGAKYKFYIPQELGYGNRTAGNDIRPYSTLIFTVELIEFK